MAAYLCRCQLDIAGMSRATNLSRATNFRISSSHLETGHQSVAFEKETPFVTLGTESKEKSTDFCDRYVRWTTRATAAAASLTLITAAPTVLAAEVDFSNSTPIYAIPGDRSLSIAIPIPDQGTWIFAESGFLAPPPRGSGRGFSVTRNPQTGGCPSWHPINLEMVVPDGVRPKSFPRQGPQWPALYIIEDESQTIYSEVMETSDTGVRYASLLDALLRMSDTTLTCFRL